MMSSQPVRFSSGSQVFLELFSHFTRYQVLSSLTFIPLIISTTHSVFLGAAGFFGWFAFSSSFLAASSLLCNLLNSNSCSFFSRSSSRALFLGSYSGSESLSHFLPNFCARFFFFTFSPGKVNLPLAPFPLVCFISSVSTAFKRYFLILGA